MRESGVKQGPEHVAKKEEGEPMESRAAGAMGVKGAESELGGTTGNGEKEHGLVK